VTLQLPARSATRPPARSRLSPDARTALWTLAWAAPLAVIVVIVALVAQWRDYRAALDLAGPGRPQVAGALEPGPTAPELTLTLPGATDVPQVSVPEIRQRPSQSFVSPSNSAPTATAPAPATESAPPTTTVQPAPSTSAPPETSSSTEPSPEPTTETTPQSPSSSPTAVQVP
jgi:hypothetical protein